MALVDNTFFKQTVETIFNRWTALKLCVEHGMGGKTGHQVTCSSYNIVTIMLLM